MLTRRSGQLASALALLAATLAASQPVRSDDSTRIEIEARRCVESTESTHVNATDCPDFFALLTLDSGWFAADLSIHKQLGRTDLVDLYRLSTKPVSRQSRWQQSTGTLDAILSDYQDLKDDEPNPAQEFFRWLAQKLDNSEFAQRIADLSDNLRLPPNALKYLLYTIAALLAGLALLALAVLVRTLVLNVNPRGISGTTQNPHIATGEERGNVPVLSLSEIRKLSATQQPAALLVAAVDYLRGSLLPDNPWASTNAEISKAVTDGDRSMARPFNTLISNAERTLYGEKPVTADQLDASFQAATRILESESPTALSEPSA